jgi:hypothetical protein
MGNTETKTKQNKNQAMSDIINVRFSRVLEKKIKPQWMLVIDITFTEPCCYITKKTNKKQQQNTQKKPKTHRNIPYILYPT